MTKKKFTCDTCDAYGTINHELDSEYYEICVCPFCGSELPVVRETEEDDE